MKKNVAMLICTILICMSFTTVARADIGPKPSIQIDFEGLGDELCYGTLLSERSSTGPAWAWDGTAANAKHNGNENYSYETFDYETWKAFVEYEDTDGYYFLQEGWRVDETKELNWTYYPPSKFKILLYFPENDTFVVSGIYERYAFDSYYTVDMIDFSISNVEAMGEIVAEESYDFTWEIISLVARIVATILIEIGIAFLFLYSNKKQIRFIAIVNMITQVLLNVALNVINYKSGFMAFCFAYVALEIAVFIIEAFIYKGSLHKFDENKRAKFVPVAYALVANLGSFLIGYVLAQWIPGMV